MWRPIQTWYVLLQVEEGQSPLSEVEQRDACVRLQEIFQDRKSALNHIVDIIEQSYEQILQVIRMNTYCEIYSSFRSNY